MNQLADTLATLRPEARDLVRGVIGIWTDEYFQKEKEACPTLFFIDDQGTKVIPVPNEMMSDEKKPTLWSAIAQMRRAFLSVAFISEVWMAKCGKEDLNADGTVKVMPQDNPNKTEWIMLNLWEGRRNITFHAEITRNPTKLGEWGVLFDSAFPKKGGPDSLGGRMMDGEPCALEGN
jgi:hypothetical protein